MDSIENRKFVSFKLFLTYQLNLARKSSYQNSDCSWESSLQRRKTLVGSYQQSYCPQDIHFAVPAKGNALDWCNEDERIHRLPEYETIHSGNP
jgi:hypothetical protein